MLHYSNVELMLLHDSILTKEELSTFESKAEVPFPHDVVWEQGKETNKIPVYLELHICVMLTLT